MELSTVQKQRLAFLTNLLYAAALLTLVYVLLKYTLRFAAPLVLALAFASAVRPLTRFLSRETRTVRSETGEPVVVRRRFPMNRTLAGVLSVLALYLVLAGLLVLAVSRLAEGAVALAAGAPAFYENSVVPGINRLYERVLSVSQRMDGSVAAVVRASLPNLVSSLGSAVSGFSARLVSVLTGLAGRLPSILLNVLITVIATVFISVDFDRIKAFLRLNLPERALRVAVNARNSFLDTVWRFTKSYFLLFLVTAGENVLGLLLLGVSRPVLIGVLIAVLDAFPVVGSGTVLLPWAAVLLLTGGVSRGLGLLGLYAVILVVRQILEPRIVGRHVGLRPIVTLTCMYVGTRLFGGVGLFAMPILAAILADLNRSGIVPLFRTAPAEEKREEMIQTGGIEA